MPGAPQAPPQRARCSRPRRVSQGQRKREQMPKILVVEDSNMMQVYYTQILSRMPSCQFSFVKNGQEALDHIDRKGPPDVVVLDINMPVMDGLEFLGRFRAGRPTPPAVVIIVSTEGRDDDL